MTEVTQLKQEDSEANAEQLEELRVHGMLQFVSLRRLNRIAHFRCKKARDLTSDAKHQIDQQNLRLQNLLYEVMHLQKEITKCLEFKSEDEGIELVPVDDFYSQAPETISRPTVTKEDSHQQTLARLEWELEQRKRLSVELAETEKSKETIDSETKAKRDYLDSLLPKLNGILQHSKPVQEYLEMPLDEVRIQQQTATFLPQPLYVLYMQASAYSSACDKDLTVSILGDIDVVKPIEEMNLDLDEDSDSDNEDLEKPREKRRRRATCDDQLHEKKQKVLRKHPLSVQLTVKCPGGSVLELTFSYLLVLNIVTVDVKLDLGPDAKDSRPVSGSELFLPHTILTCLYPDDTGLDTPNPANKYTLNRLGLGEFGQYISQVGQPYLWAQWLCGLQFMGLSGQTPSVQPSLSGSYMEDTIRRLRQRVRAKLSLRKQLSFIERGQIVVNSAYQNLFPAKISTRLTSWKQSIYQDFAAESYTQPLLQAGLVPEEAMFFVTVLERGSAKMTIQVCVSHNYPQTAPLFATRLKWGKEITAKDNENIKNLEAEVNIHYPELMRKQSRDQLLTNQLQRLLMCLDVFLEASEDAPKHGGPAEFCREKILPRLTRGPHRLNPFKFCENPGFFTQR